MGAGTDSHHDHAARRQLRAPGQELLAAQRPVRQHATAPIHGLHLNHALGKIDAHTRRSTSDNLAHGTSSFDGCRLMTRTVNLGASTPLPEGGKSLHIAEVVLHLLVAIRPQMNNRQSLHGWCRPLSSNVGLKFHDSAPAYSA